MPDATVAPAGSGRHEWDRLIPAWHLAFGVLATLTGALLLLGNGLARQLTGLVALLVLAGWYAVVGAPALHRDDPGRRGLAYLAVAAPVTIGLYAVSPTGSLMLFMLYPHVWMLLPARRAIAATAGAVVLTAAVALGWIGPDPATLGQVGVVAAVSLLMAVGLGLWITRIIEQSHRRARLVEELAAARAELATVSRRAGVLAERERLSREIHDTLAQGFTSVLLLIEAADAALGRDQRLVRERLGRAQQTVRDNLAEARAMVAKLAPPALRDGSLPAALQEVVARAEPELAGSVTLTVRGDPRTLPADQEVVLMRVVQEGLTNVRRHAAVARAEVCLEYEPTRVRLRVSDDGDGFDPGEPTVGFGLAGLRERVRQVGGTVVLHTAPGAGVTLSVEVGS